MKENYFSYEIVKKIVRNHRWSIGFCTLFFFLIPLLWMGALPQLYQAKATFKEASESRESPSLGMIKQLIDPSSAGDNEASASAIMSSRTCVLQVIQKLGLQVREYETFASRLKRRFTSEEQDLLPFQDVVFTGQLPLELHIKPLSADSYEIEQLGRVGKVGETIDCGVVQWKLTQIPKKRLAIQLLPEDTVLDHCLRKLKIRRKKDEKRILEILFSHENNQVAQNFVNFLMHVYKEYLKEDFEHIALAQIDYLERRQTEIAKVFDRYLEEYVTYLKDNVGNEGFINLTQEIGFIKDKKRRMSERLLDLDLLMQKQQEGDVSKEDDGFDLAEMHRRLTLKKAALSRDFSRLNLVKQPEELDQKETLLNRLFATQTAFAMPFNPPPRPRYELSPVSCVESEKKRLDDIRQKISQIIPVASDRPSQVKLKQLRLEEHLSEQRWVHSSLKSDAFDGIDLETAKLLYVKFQEGVQQKEERVAKLQYVQTLMKEQPDFEISAFAGLFTDPVSSELVKKSSQIMGQMRDEKNLMAKDHMRLKDSLAKEKKSLLEHVKHQLELEKLDLALYQNKLHELNAVTFDLVNQEIYFLDEQFQKIKTDKLDLFEKEKGILLDRLAELKTTMESFPGKWLMENRLQLKTEMIMNVMEGISQLVESKNVEYHLRQFESKPIDFAFLPRKKQPDFLWLFSFVGAGLGFLGSTSLLSLRAMNRGLPLTSGWLKEHSITSMPLKLLQSKEPSTEELDWMRKLQREVLFRKNSPIRLGIFTNGYSTALPSLLADLYAECGMKALVFTFDGDMQRKRGRGWLSFLSGEIEQLPIKAAKSHDTLSPGHQDVYLPEKIKSSTFKQMLTKVDREYDVTLFHITDPLPSEKAISIIPSCDFCVVHSKRENSSEVAMYLQEKTIFFI